MEKVLRLVAEKQVLLQDFLQIQTVRNLAKLSAFLFRDVSCHKL